MFNGYGYPAYTDPYNGQSIQVQQHLPQQQYHQQQHQQQHLQQQQQQQQQQQLVPALQHYQSQVSITNASIGIFIKVFQ